MIQCYLMNDTQYKKGQTITYTKEFMFGKTAEITAKIVAIKKLQGRIVILTTEGDELVVTSK